nr:hypothetical protein [Tanacetum cinerariifolium]
MMDEELEQLLEGTKNVDKDEFMEDIFNDQEDLRNMIDPRSYKESLKEKKSAEDVTITNDDVEEALVGDEFELKRKERGKDAPSSADKEKLHELTVTDSTPSSSSPKPKNEKAFISLLDIYNQQWKKFFLQWLVIESMRLQRRLSRSMLLKKERENLRAEITLQVTNVIANSIPSHIKFKKPAPSVAPYSIAVICTRDHEDHQDDYALLEGESSANRQKTFEHGTYSIGESSSEQHTDQEPNPSYSDTQEQLDEFDAWVDGLGTDDDEVPTEEVSPELMEEISKEIDEAQLQKLEGKVVFTDSKETSSTLSQLPKRSKSSTNDFAESRLILLEV